MSIRLCPTVTADAPVRKLDVKASVGRLLQNAHSVTASPKRRASSIIKAQSEFTVILIHQNYNCNRGIIWCQRNGTFFRSFCNFILSNWGFTETEKSKARAAKHGTPSPLPSMQLAGFFSGLHMDTVLSKACQTADELLLMDHLDHAGRMGWGPGLYTKVNELNADIKSILFVDKK